MLSISTVSVITAVSVKSRLSYLKYYIIFLWDLILYLGFNMLRTYEVTMLNNISINLYTFIFHFVFIPSIIVFFLLFIHDLAEESLSILEKGYLYLLCLFNMIVMLLPFFTQSSPEKIYQWYFDKMASLPGLFMCEFFIIIFILFIALNYKKIKLIFMKKVMKSLYLTSICLVVLGNILHFAIFNNPSFSKELMQTIDIAFAYALFVIAFMIANFILFVKYVFGHTQKDPESLIFSFVHQYKISLREKDVLENALENRTYQQIADRLFLSTKTVESHISKIYKKTNVNNRDELIKLYQSYNTVRMD